MSQLVVSKCHIVHLSVRFEMSNKLQCFNIRFNTGIHVLHIKKHLPALFCYQTIWPVWISLWEQWYTS